MALLFLLMTLVIAFLLFDKRAPAYFLLVLFGIGCWLVFWHHATDILKINW